ncbi:MAG: Gfo/Idh/MocA family oxidoreductase [Armatimonadetes bacterium]|nr:Gfo/Idh/MocA family oxidoreductase [Armatimonadota bacterium]
MGRLTEIRCAVIGYGMGKFHAEEIERTDGMRLVAICDVNPKRLEQAKNDFPKAKTYQRVEELLTDGDFDLAVIVTPHNSHAPLTLKFLKAGKHVVVEKPMCITVKEATAMIETAKQKGLMLTVYHNRHWDGDFMAIREVVESGIIGEIFHVEMFGGGYYQPGYQWRSEKSASGGLFYDWGAHYLWWLLQLIPHPIESVVGSFHKLKWHDVTNEDHVQAFIRFANGAVADVQFSTIASAGKPRWFILGTEGAIVDRWEGKFSLYFFVNGVRAETQVPYKQSRWFEFYRNVANHLLRGEELAIKPEQARRVIAIMEYAERSAKQGGKALALPYEQS